MSAAKTRRWSPGPPLAIWDPSPSVFVAAARVAPPPSTEDINPLWAVRFGTCRLVGQPAHGAAADPTGRQSPSGAGTSAVASSVGLREVDAGVYSRPSLCSTRRPVTPTPPSTTRATRVQEGPRRLV